MTRWNNKINYYYFKKYLDPLGPLLKIGDILVLRTCPAQKVIQKRTLSVLYSDWQLPSPSPTSPYVCVSVCLSCKLKFYLLIAFNVIVYSSRMFKKVKEGSRRFKKVQEGSRMLKNVPECWLLVKSKPWNNNVMQLNSVSQGYTRLPMLTQGNPRLHAVPWAAGISMSLHAVPIEGMHFHDLAYSSIWACMKFLELACSYISLHAFPWTWDPRLPKVSQVPQGSMALHELACSKKRMHAVKRGCMPCSDTSLHAVT